MHPDVIVIGAGISGMATALRLQARGVSTLLLEAHGQVGGCAGFFCERGFAFDVGATTLVDFEPGGVGGQFLSEIGMPPLSGEALPGYRAWLPDRTLTLFRDSARWHHERLAQFGDMPGHRRFWALLDQLAETFWDASRNGIKLPLASPLDLLRTARLIKPRDWPLTRYLFRTVDDALRACGLAEDKALRGLLAMLLQDTVHASPADAPLINSALGITIRGAGLTRARGGMRGFWRALVAHYRALGGTLRVGTRADWVSRAAEGFVVRTRRGDFHARQIVSTLPIWNSACLGLHDVTAALAPYLRRDEGALGGALAVFLGVPEEEVAGQSYTHHQVLTGYDQPLGDGNNLFISVSAPDDTDSAPAGYRAVMLSTHCELDDWEDLAPEAYAQRKTAMGEHLLAIARRVYPNLAAQPMVYAMGTPRTYETYTHRHRGAVGGVRLNLRNSNQFAVPYDIGVPGFWQAGDTAWPGLGTVACVLGSRHVADGICRQLSPARERRNAHGQLPLHPKGV